MKTFIKYFFITLSLFYSSYSFSQGNVGIGTTNPESSAILDIQSTDKGVLVPRMDSLQRVSIMSPATGLLVYETTTSAFWTWNGSTWQRVNREDIIISEDNKTYVSVNNSNTISMYADNQLALNITKDANGHSHFNPGSGFQGNIFFGDQAGAFNDGGVDNTVFGGYAFANNVIGTQNVAIGTQSLASNLGNYNTGVGSRTLMQNENGLRNVAVGFGALQFGQSLFNNIAVGDRAMRYAQTGGFNIAIGNQAAEQDSFGMHNIFIGNLSGQYNTADENLGMGSNTLKSNQGFYNVGVGHNALAENRTGEDNTAFGNTAMNANITGIRNVAIGAKSLLLDSVGSYNTALGFESLHLNTSGSGNIAIGYQAGKNSQESDKLFIENSSSSTPLIWGDFVNDSVKIYGALSIGNEYTFPIMDGLSNQILMTDGNGNLSWDNKSNTSVLNDLTDVKTDYTTDLNLFIGLGSGNTIQSGGSGNTAVGIDALKLNETGQNNTALGTNALEENETGKWNVALGNSSLLLNTTGDTNTSVGTWALRENSIGDGNVAIGSQAMGIAASSNFNTAIGTHALYRNNGNFNVGLGYEADFFNLNGYSNTIVGASAGSGATFFTRTGAVYIGFEAGRLDTTDNKLYIENSDSSTPLIWGDFANDTVKIYGIFGIKDEFTFPITDGSFDQILKTDGNGNLSWTEDNSADLLNDLFDVKVDYLVDNNLFGGLDAGLNIQAGGSKNLGWGQESLRLLTTGDENVALGYRSLATNQTGLHNTGIGSEALQFNTGNYNTAIGRQALTANVSGSSNTAIGSQALFTNSIGSNNTALGYQSLLVNTDGNNNVALGWLALTNNTSGSANIAIGSEALSSLSDRSNNIAIGHQALKSNGFGASGPTEGLLNTAIGHQSLTANTTGYGNTGLGYQTLDANLTGFYNTAVGVSALGSLTTGELNTAAGYGALESNIQGDQNSAFGYYSLYQNSSGNLNTGLGTGTLYSNTSGSNNTAIGNQAGFLNTGSDNVFLGDSAGYNEIFSDKLYIDNSPTSTPLIYGDFLVDSLNFNGKVRINCTGSIYDFVTTEYLGEPILRSTQTNYGYVGSPNHTLYKTYSNFFYAGDVANYQTYSDRRIKENIVDLNSPTEKFMKLKPVKYDIKTSHYLKGRDQSEKELENRTNQMGFIAQEVEEIYPGLVNTDKENGLKSMSYQGLIPVLVDVVQKQEKQIQDLNLKVEQLIQLLESKK